MNRTEKYLLGVALLAIVMRFALIPGWAVLMILSFSTLSLVYTIFGFAILNNIAIKRVFSSPSPFKGISALRMMFVVAAGFTLSVAALAILFKLMRWPGGNIMSLEAIAGLAVALVVALIKAKQPVYNKIAIRAAVAISVCTLIYWNPGSIITKVLYRKHPAYVQAVVNLNNDPTNKALQDEVKRQEEMMRNSYPERDAARGGK